MIRFTSALTVVLAVLSACSKPDQQKKSTPIGYEMKTYRLASPPDCKSDTACAEFVVTYPVFEGIDSAVAAKINRDLELTFSLGDPEASEKTLEHVATEFVQSYQSFTSEFPETAQGWFFHGDARVDVLLDTLVSISVNEEYYTGGAHGGSGKYFINVDPRTGQAVTTASVFKPGYEQALTRAGEIAFRGERGLGPDADLMENAFEFPENRFKLNDNYGFTPDGIVFYYNSYEIAPYAAGPTEIKIPYSEVLDWLIIKPVQKQVSVEKGT